MSPSWRNVASTSTPRWYTSIDCRKIAANPSSSSYYNCLFVCPFSTTFRAALPSLLRLNRDWFAESIKCIEIAMITCDQAFHNMMAHESIHAKQLVMTFWHWILNKDQNTAIIPYYVKILPWHVQKLYAKFPQAELHIISKYGCALHYKNVSWWDDRGPIWDISYALTAGYITIILYLTSSSKHTPPRSPGIEHCEVMCIKRY